MITVIDNFYDNVDEVRDFALSLDFDIKGNYPGNRTGPVLNELWRSYIIEELEKITGKTIINFPYDYNTSFQVTLEEDTTWVHHDAMSFAAVVYLTPDAPLDTGTAIYRHKHTGIMRHYEGQLDLNDTPTRSEDWEIVVEVKNIYNRLVIYNSQYYHSSIKPGFGSDKTNGRLFQTFFFEAM